MGTQIPQNEIQAFCAFLERRLDSGDTGLTPEQSVSEFRTYQADLRRFLQESEPAYRQAENGEVGDLDIDAIMERVAARLERTGSSS